MKVLITGGRNFTDRNAVYRALDKIDASGQISHLIEGGAPGADALARGWALARGAQVVECIANWRLYGDSAGPRRNAAMLDLKPDVVVAFPGGNGTASMTRLARGMGLEVVEPIPSAAPKGKP